MNFIVFLVEMLKMKNTYTAKKTQWALWEQKVRIQDKRKIIRTPVL